MSQFDITRHIDYENHMRDYIKKTEAKQIIDNIKNQVGYRPIQSHPDYPALMNMLKDQHIKEMSKLEQEMKRKTQAPGSINEITQHPDYKTVMQKYENEIRRLTRQVSLLEAQTQAAKAPAVCPPAKECPACPTKQSRFNVTTVDPDYTVKTNIIVSNPIAANNYPPPEVPSAPSWRGLFGGGFRRTP